MQTHSDAALLQPNVPFVGQARHSAISHAMQEGADLAEMGSEVLEDVVQHPSVGDGHRPEGHRRGEGCVLPGRKSLEPPPLDGVETAIAGMEKCLGSWAPCN